MELQVLPHTDVELSLPDLRDDKSRVAQPYHITGPSEAFQNLEHALTPSKAAALTGASDVQLQNKLHMQGFLSPVMPCSLPPETRPAAGIPLAAEYVAFAYPACFTWVAQGEQPPDFDPTDRNTKWKSVNTDNDVLRLANDQSWAFFLVVGGFVYLDKSKKLLQTNALTLAPSDYKMIFEETIVPKREWVAALEKDKRMCAVTLDALYSSGFRRFAWVLPNEAPGDHPLSDKEASEESSYKCGGFMYEIAEAPNRKFFRLVPHSRSKLKEFKAAEEIAKAEDLQALDGFKGPALDLLREIAASAVAAEGRSWSATDETLTILAEWDEEKVGRATASLARYGPAAALSALVEATSLLSDRCTRLRILDPRLANEYEQCANRLQLAAAALLECLAIAASRAASDAPVVPAEDKPAAAAGVAAGADTPRRGSGSGQAEGHPASLASDGGYPHLWLNIILRSAVARKALDHAVRNDLKILTSQPAIVQYIKRAWWTNLLPGIMRQLPRAPSGESASYPSTALRLAFWVAMLVFWGVLQLFSLPLVALWPPIERMSVWRESQLRKADLICAEACAAVMTSDNNEAAEAAEETLDRFAITRGKTSLNLEEPEPGKAWTGRRRQGGKSFRNVLVLKLQAFILDHLSFKTDIRFFLYAPAAKFAMLWLSDMGLFVILTAFSTEALGHSIWSVVLLAWVSSGIFLELREVYDAGSLTAYLTVFNFCDSFGLLLALGYLLLARQTVQSWEGEAAALLDGPRLLSANDTWTTGPYSTAISHDTRFLRAIALFFLGFRQLRVFLISPVFGPFVLMVIEMFKDVFRFLMILLPLIAIFAAAITAAYEDPTDEKWPFDTHITTVFVEVRVEDEQCSKHFRTLPHTFITLMEGAVTGGGDAYECLGQKSGLLFVLGFMREVLVGLLLLNMLIAMMAKTFDNVYEASDVNYMKLKAAITLSATENVRAPPPLYLLSLPYEIWLILRGTYKAMIARCRCTSRKNPRKVAPDSLADEGDAVVDVSSFVSALNRRGDTSDSAAFVKELIVAVLASGRLDTTDLARHITMYISDRQDDIAEESRWRTKLSKKMVQHARQQSGRIEQLEKKLLMQNEMLSAIATKLGVAQPASQNSKSPGRRGQA